MTPADAKKLWADARINGARLDTCQGPHAFVDATPEKQIGKRWRCFLCRGECDSAAKHYYEQGLAHGRAVARVRPCPRCEGTGVKVTHDSQHPCDLCAPEHVLGEAVRALDEGSGRQ